MSNKTNHIKAPIEDTLRGLGRLDYTEGSRLHSTLKRITSTFAGNDKHIGKRKEKTEIVCDLCKQTFRVRGNKLPRHTSYKYGDIRYDKICGEKSNVETKPFDKLAGLEEVEYFKIELTGDKIFEGDKILVNISDNSISDARSKDLITLETVVEKIYKVINKQDRNAYRFKFEGFSNLILLERIKDNNIIKI